MLYWPKNSQFCQVHRIAGIKKMPKSIWRRLFEKLIKTFFTVFSQPRPHWKIWLQNTWKTNEKLNWEMLKGPPDGRQWLWFDCEINLILSTSLSIIGESLNLYSKVRRRVLRWLGDLNIQRPRACAKIIVNGLYCQFSYFSRGWLRM